MKKNIVLKLVAFVVLNIFMTSVGIVSFAKYVPPDSINWNHLGSCGVLFEESEDNYPYFYCGGETTVGSGKNAYVLIELQKLVDAPNEIIWETVYSASDYDYMLAGVEDEVEVETDTTYRLKATFQARTLSGDVLEEYVRYSAAHVILSQDI